MEAQPPQYSLVRFWRYIFTPLVLVFLGLAWYVTFNMSGYQLAVSPLAPVKDVLQTAPIPSAGVSN